MLLARQQALRSSLPKFAAGHIRRTFTSPAKHENAGEIESFIVHSTDMKNTGPAPTSFTVPVHTLSSEESVQSVDLPPNVFGVPVRPDILHRVVVWKLACLRRGTGSAKTRGEMVGSKAKLGNQKGGGRARIGNNRTPVRRGGGTAFGPKPRDFSYNLPKKVRLLGMKCALAAKFAQNKLVILDNFNIPTVKTNQLHKTLKSKGWDNVLFVDGAETSPYFYLASKNIPDVTLLPQGRANVYDILRRKYLVLNLESLDHLIKRVNGELPTVSKRAARAKNQRRKKAEYKSKKSVAEAIPEATTEAASE
eukprot:TRINITY_DN12869_c0_g1_i1.p1 TRINITY_DN12869_c0_g1~~TRINITY_DN12869_c0_g1_i1.p1  ORF type:complete len:307 (-),score=55.48 TRINITY_DN12869_c0_g1_i1:23-943(-)